jgi:hypothetical protein
MIMNINDVTRGIIRELQEIAFANLDENPHVKMNHKLSALKELIKLLDLKDETANIARETEFKFIEKFSWESDEVILEKGMPLNRKQRRALERKSGKSARD